METIYTGDALTAEQHAPFSIYQFYREGVLGFYHRRLRCFLLVDLKVGKLTQQDIGQMLLYTGYYEAEEMQEGETRWKPKRI